MYLKAFSIFLFLVYLSPMAYTQDCSLGIGSDNKGIITQIFQLNDEQSGKLEGWKAEMAIETKIIEEEIQFMFDNEPQSTPNELTVLATKYRVLQEKMVNTSMGYDRKLISIFNEKQYERYISLCQEASRKPITKEPE